MGDSVAACSANSSSDFEKIVGSPVYYVTVRVAPLRATLIDHRASRSVHACDLCLAATSLGYSDCACSIHYGFCTSVVLEKAKDDPSTQLLCPVPVPIKPVESPPSSPPPAKPDPPKRTFKEPISRHLSLWQTKSANMLLGGLDSASKQPPLALLSSAANAAKSLIDRVKAGEGFRSSTTNAVAGSSPPSGNSSLFSSFAFAPGGSTNAKDSYHFGRHSLSNIHGDLPPHHPSLAPNEQLIVRVPATHMINGPPSPTTSVLRRSSAPATSLAYLSQPSSNQSQSNQTPIASTNGVLPQQQQSSQPISNGRSQQPLTVSSQQSQLLNQKQPITPSIVPSADKFNAGSQQATASQQKQLPPLDSHKPSASGTNGAVSSSIPRFYYPLGKPMSSDLLRQQTDRLVAAFEKLGNVATRVQVGEIARDCIGLGRYWRVPLFLKAQSLAGVVDRADYVTKDAFVSMWKRMTTQCFDNASRFIWLLSSTTPANLPSSLIQQSTGQPAPAAPRSGRPGTAAGSLTAPVPSSCLFALPQDFIPMMQDIVDNHPSLDFLRDAKEFHSRYMHTVIARIFYAINRSWSGRLVVAELRQSRFLEALARLDDEDVNRSTEFFSYEHFYVIYCKFWELDKDHDLLITRDELSTHNNHAISPRIIDRIFSGAVTKGRCLKEGKMSYNEFVWFLISEEDKKHPTSIEYWFRCMDLDGDGYLTTFEMEFFYEEQHQRLMQMSIEPLSLKDLICQLLDMVNPKIPGKITLSDLKACRLSDVFFNTFINIYKYIDYEQKDPFSNLRELEQMGDSNVPVTDWERFAAQEYMTLVAEESSNDGGTGGNGGGSGMGSSAGNFNQNEDVDGSLSRITGLGCSDDEF